VVAVFSEASQRWANLLTWCRCSTRPLRASVSARVGAALRKTASKSDDWADRHPEAMCDEIWNALTALHDRFAEMVCL
jgi:hypothetical protein